MEYSYDLDMLIGHEKTCICYGASAISIVTTVQNRLAYASHAHVMSCLNDHAITITPNKWQVRKDLVNHTMKLNKCILQGQMEEISIEIIDF